MKTGLVEVQLQAEMLYILKVFSKNTEKLSDEIANLVAFNKNKIQHTPIILEIKNKHFQVSELAVLIEILTQNNMMAIGIRSQVQELIDFAKFSGLAVFDKPIPISEEKFLRQTKSAPVTKEMQEKEHHPPKIIINEVGASEQVVAKDSDLILLSGIKADGEAISHGNVSAYKEVSGKIFAGVDGDKKASIFIHFFNIQLASIAGIYKQFDVVPSKLKGHSVLINLKDETLRCHIVK